MRKSFFGIWLLLAAFTGQAQLQARFMADIRSGCAPIRVVFADQSAGNPDRWRWDLGNGVISTSQNPSTTYLNAGYYTIRLTVYRGTDSAIFEQTGYIQAYANPLVNFTASPRAGCLPLTVQFEDSTSAPNATIASYDWDFGDGSLGTGQNPVHTYTNIGSFRISLTVRTTDGCSGSRTIENYVNVGERLSAQFSLLNPVACSLPATVSFFDSSTGTNLVSWQWQFGDGAVSNQRNPQHAYTNAGDYDVRLVVTNAGGCTDTLLRRAVVSVGRPTASFAYPGDTLFCTGRPVVVTNTSAPFSVFDSVIWRFSDGVELRQQDAFRTFPLPGVYAFRLVVWKNGCADSVSSSFFVRERPSPSFENDPDTACAAPLTVTFRITTPNSTVIRWIFHDGSESTAQQPTFTYRGVGRFGVTMVVQHNSGCIDTLVKSEAVLIFPPTITGVSGLPYNGCVPYTNTFVPAVALFNPLDSVVSYQWDLGDGTNSNARAPQKTYSIPGDFVVRLTITTLSGCTHSFQDTIRIRFRPTPFFSATPREVCPNTDVFFTDSSQGTITGWLWLFGDGGSSTLQNPTYRYNDTGWMQVTLVVFNGACSDSLTIDRMIYVRPPIARFTDSFSCSNQRQRFFRNESIGATQWTWFFGNGDSSSVFNPVYTYPDLGRYTVTLRVSDSACTHELRRELLVLDEVANIELERPAGCLSGLFRFTARGPSTNPANIRFYDWLLNGSDQRITTVNYTELAITDTGSIAVRLIINDLNNCRDTTNVVFRITDVGTIPRFGPAPQFACVGDLVAFRDSSLFGPSNRIVRWEWNFGTGSDSVFLSPPFGVRYYRPGIYDVTLTVEDSVGCRYSVTRPAAVVVRETIADFVASDTAVCTQYPIQFTSRSIGADSTTAALAYEWDFGNGTTSTQQNPLVAYADTGLYTVTLIVTDPFGCSDTLQRLASIRVGNARADFTMSDSFSTCPPLVVRFTNLSQDAIRTTWDFGNGNFSSFPNPAHTYTSPGEYFVKLVADGYTGCRDSVIKRIAIQGPVGTFSYSPLIGCPPLQVRFSSNTQSANFFTWDFSDGESIVVVNDTALHTYTLPGSYVPRLILDDGLGCRVPVQGTDTIRVLGAKAFIQSLAQNSFCDSAVVSFIDSSVVNDVVTRVRWRFGDGSESDLRNPVHVYRQPGRYLVTLEVFTQNNCYSSDTLQVPVIISQTPRFVIRDSGLSCVPDTVQFFALWQNPDSSQIRYRWDLGNGQISQALLPPSVRYDLPGTFQIRLQTTNEFGCTSTATLPYTVNDTPRVQATPNAFVCAGSGIALRATGAATYQWDSDVTLSCTHCASPTATPAADRIYRVVGTDANGCQSADTLLLRVKQRGNLVVSPGDTLCAGESFQLRAQGFERYQWIPSTYLNNPTSPNPISRPLISINYRVVGSDTLGCFSDSAIVPVVVYQIPAIDISESLIRASLGTVLPLRTVSSADVVSWSWNPAADLSCNGCPEPLLTVSRRQVYTLTARNDGDCVATDNVTIEPYCSAGDVFVPNTFSPNGDGRNDRFYPMGRGITTVRSIQIFNRWGELVFERRSFGLNDPAAGWDGTYKGRLLSPDVYVYTMELLCASNELFTLKGNVTLLQ